MCTMETMVKKWDFGEAGDTLGWTIPDHFSGYVFGGALWISMTTTAFNVDGPWSHVSPVRDGEHGRFYTLDSPTKLGISAGQMNKVKIRLLNRSPETDGFVHWVTRDDPDTATTKPWCNACFKGQAHFSMKPYHPEWQEIVCHVDDQWEGIIEQIGITLGLLTHKGDIWIDSIAVTHDRPRPPLYRPDLVSDRIVPRVSIPGITQEEFQDAFRVLDEGLIVDVPFHGFEYPFFTAAAGGREFGWSWWQLDCSLCLGGAKWVNQEFAENVIRGFIGVQAQNPDGRIDHNGGVPVRGGPHHLSSLPRYFEIAYDIARRTADRALRESIYDSMRNYYEWWSRPIVKCDPATGLITGWFEESIGYTRHFDQPPHTIAPVDLNVAVALGSDRLARLADELGDVDGAVRYRTAFDKHTEAINLYLWDEEDSVYYPYNVKERRRDPRLTCTVFDTFRLQMAGEQRIQKLIPKLLDPSLFNWGTLPVTTAAKGHPDYSESEGIGGASNFGIIWILRNMPIIDGLMDIGRHDLATELAWQTIKAFNGRYNEFLSPRTGDPMGTPGYCYAASLYAQAIIEYLFGIDYDLVKGQLRIMPHVPDELANHEFSIEGLILPADGDVRLSVRVRPDKGGGRSIRVGISGEPPKGLDLAVLQAQDAKEPDPRPTALPENTPFEVTRSLSGGQATVGIQTPASGMLEVRFV